LTRATQQLLEQVEALPDHERSELVAELARRVALAPHDAPTDEDLTAAADRRYVELDRASSPDAVGAPAFQRANRPSDSDIATC